MQIGLLVLIWTLTAIWLLTPERLQALERSADWYGDLFRGLQPGFKGGSPLLEPMGRTATTPLAEFGDVAFWGCDFRMEDGRLYLVTRWRRPLKDTALTAHLIFAMNGETLATDSWPLNTDQHNSPVPLSFWKGRRGEIWLMLESTPSGEAFMPTASLLPVLGQRVRVCR